MKRILCSFLFMILSLIANADSLWKWLGPPAGTVAELVPDRNNPNLWFAVNNASLYRSEDDGSTWQRKQLENVVSVSVNPVGSEVLVITGKSFHQRQIWVSHDSGKSFVLRTTVPFPLRKIFPHPQKRDVVYAFGFSPKDLGVSTDHGLNWQIFKNIPVELYDYDEIQFTDFLISPTNPEMLFASGSIASDYFSTALSIQSSDSGKTWTVESKKYGFHWDPAFPERAFSFNHDGIRKLSDKGWIKISNQPADLLSSVPNAENVLVAVVLKRVALIPIVSTFRSDDVGKTWTKVQLDLQNNVTVLNGSSNGILAGTEGGGIYRKNEKGWHTVNTGIREARILNVESGGDKIYGLSGIDWFQPGGRFLFKRDAETNSWSNLGFRMPLPKTGQIETIAVNPLKPDLIFALIPYPTQLLRSIDGGQSWSAVTGIPKRDLFGSIITFDPKQPDIVYFSRVSDPAVFRSANDGLSFTRLPAVFDTISYPLHILPDAFNPQTIYFSSHDRGIYKSTDGGQSVQLLHVFGCGDYCKNGPLDIAPMPQQDSYLVLLDRGQVMLTQNGGQTWNRIGQINGNDSSDRPKLFPMNNNGNDFIAVFNSKLFESHDGGKSWNNITAQIGSNLEIFDITDPRFGPLYVATNRGIYSRN
jgi:photosystem II stability/assembly factor-like uncharacterized protein